MPILETYIPRIEATLHRRDIIALFDEIAGEVDPRSAIESLIDIGIAHRNARVLSFANIANSVLHNRQR